jgi:predicted lipid-binding transport protein (Tim44 family)
MVDDFAIFGFIGGIFSYLIYAWVERNDPKNHMSIWAGMYGTFLSGAVGGLLAIVFDSAIQVSIVVGFLNEIIYMSFLKAAKSGKFFGVFKELLIKYLTGGLK